MTKSVVNVLKWTLKADAIKDPSSSTVLMSGNPTQVFMECEHAPLHQAEEEKAPMRSQGMFPVGTIVQRRLRAPMVHVDGRCARAAWSGTKLFEGRVVDQFRDLVSRRFSYRVLWDATSFGRTVSS